MTEKPQTYTARPTSPRNCKVCGVEFMPTHHLQETCPEHRARKPDHGVRSIGTDLGLTEEEKEWKRYGDRVASKLAKRADAPVLSRVGDAA